MFRCTAIRKGGTSMAITIATAISRLYVFCDRHLILAKLRSADMNAAAGAVEEVARLVARISARWPRTRILLRR